MENPTKKKLKLTLNVIENRDASFGRSKEMPLSGCGCCSSCGCTCTYGIPGEADK